MKKKEKSVDLTSSENTINELEYLMEMYHSDVPGEKEEATIELWNKTEKFIWSAMKEWYPTYYSNERFKEDIYSCCEIIFFKKIGDFNPKLGTLTTYFTNYFRHEMLEWISRETYHLSPYFLKRIKKVESAMLEL